MQKEVKSIIISDSINELMDAVLLELRKKGIEVLGGYRSAAYNNKSLRSRTYQDIQYQIKREFGVNRYEAIKSRQVDKAIEIIRDYKAPYALADEITIENNQVGFYE